MQSAKGNFVVNLDHTCNIYSRLQRNLCSVDKDFDLGWLSLILYFSNRFVSTKLHCSCRKTLQVWPYFYTLEISISVDCNLGVILLEPETYDSVLVHTSPGQNTPVQNPPVLKKPRTKTPKMCMVKIFLRENRIKISSYTVENQLEVELVYGKERKF